MMLLVMAALSGKLWAVDHTTANMSATGWEQISAMPADVNDYFFAIREHSTGAGLSLANPDNDNYEELIYEASGSCALLTLWKNGDSYVVTPADTYKKSDGATDLMLQTEYNAAQEYQTHDNGNGDLSWGNMNFIYDTDAAAWKVQNGKYPDSGYWGKSSETDDMVAANKTGDDIGLYDIYAIKRAKYLTAGITSAIDITESVTNAGAERRTLAGWTLSATDAFETQSNTELSNKVGTRYFQKWQAQASGNLADRWMQQKLTGLKEGYYTVEVKTNVTASGAFVYANEAQTELKDNSGGVATVRTYVSDDGELTYGVKLVGYESNWVAFDDFTLKYSYDIESLATPVGYYYLRNKATGKFVTFDGSWGTYYSMGEGGKQLHLTTDEDGTTRMMTTYLNDKDDATTTEGVKKYFYSHTNNKLHAFSDGNNTEGGEKWVFYQYQEDGKTYYYIKNNMTGYYLSSDEDYTDITRGGGLMKRYLEGDAEAWELVTKAQLVGEMTAEGASYPMDVTTLIDEPDFIVGWNNVYKEFYSWKVMGGELAKYSDWGATDRSGRPINIVAYYAQDGGRSNGNGAYAYSLAADFPDVLQTIEDLPEGLYVVECQAVFRDGTEGAETTSPATSSSRTHASRLSDGTYVNRAYLYANADMADEPDDARLKADRDWIYKNAQMVPVHAAPADLFAATGSYKQAAVLDAFKQGDYTVQLPVYVSNGKLTIGILQEIGINENLLVFDRFRLKYYGTNISDAKAIAKANLKRLQGYYSDYQANAVTAREKAKLDDAITAIENDYSTSDAVAKYNKVAQEYGETSINWYIYNVLQTDYDRGDYNTVAKSGDREQSTARYPFVDEASKKEVVKYFGAGNNTNNATNYYNDYGDATYSADTKFGSSANMKAHGTLEDLKDAIKAIRTYVAANAEARYIEDDRVIAGSIENKAREESRNDRMALLTGSKDAVTVSTDGTLYPAYETNAMMFGNDGATVTATQPLNKIVTNSRSWAPRDAYGHRFYDYSNYYGAGPHTYSLTIKGLLAGEYIVTVSESHNDKLTELKFNGTVGENKLFDTDKDLHREDESVWQTYTHSWQDVSARVTISDKFEDVTLTFTGRGSRTATMNITNLRIYRLEDVQMLLFDEDEKVLAKNGMDIGDGKKGYRSVKAMLRRTMTKNQWNTLVLPVNLTAGQVLAGFGEGTIMADMDGFSTDYGQPDNCIHFTTIDLSGMGKDDKAIEEGKVYLIKPTADPAVAAGETVQFKNKHENRPTYETIGGPIYYLDYVDYDVTKDETNPANGTKVPHAAPSVVQNPVIAAKGKQTGKLTLQMQGSYGKTVVPVNAKTDKGWTNYIYAFQKQEDEKVYLVELERGKTYEEFPGETGRLFKGYRGWVVASYDETTTEETPARQANFPVLIDEGNGTVTIVRGIDGTGTYSEKAIPARGIFDLQGRAVSADVFRSAACPKGLYVVDGRKVVVK